MDWTTLANLIDPQLLIVLAACWIIGFICKQTPKVPDWSIIFIVTIVAIAFAVFILGFTAAALLQGIICGAVAVYSNQVVKQVKEGASNDASKEFDKS